MSDSFQGQVQALRESTAAEFDRGSLESARGVGAEERRRQQAWIPRRIDRTFTGYIFWSHGGGSSSLTDRGAVVLRQHPLFETLPLISSLVCRLARG